MLGKNSLVDLWSSLFALFVSQPVLSLLMFIGYMLIFETIDITISICQLIGDHALSIFFFFFFALWNLLFLKRYKNKLISRRFKMHSDLICFPFS